MPEKPGKNREQLKEITDRIEAGIRDIFESGDMEKYRNYLRTMSRFHNYSLNNQALIHLQRPDATLVAGYNRWRDKFSRHVLRGEKGITIIAPTPSSTITACSSQRSAGIRAAIPRRWRPKASP